MQQYGAVPMPVQKPQRDVAINNTTYREAVCKAFRSTGCVFIPIGFRNQGPRTITKIVDLLIRC